MQLNLMISVSNTGYGIAGKNIAHEMIRRGMDLTIFPHGKYQPNVEKDSELVKLLETNKTDWHVSHPCLNIWHQFDLANHVGGVFENYLGFPIFELDNFNKREIAHLKVPDVRLVTSQWAKEILEQFINRTIKVVPLGVDLDIFNPDGPTTNLKDNPDQYIFINLGKFEKRKGHDVLVEAFNKAFTQADNVKLVMCPHNPFLNEQELSHWVNLYKGSKLGNKIGILPQVETHNEVAAIMRGSDCGVFPSRAEGWNLELLEMMACGKPVIATNYSAHTEFCNEKNTMLIEGNELEDAYDGKWFHGNGRWLEFGYNQEEELINHMIYCYKNNKINNSNGIETAGRLTWENTVNNLLEVCNL